MRWDGNSLANCLVARWMWARRIGNGRWRIRRPPFHAFALPHDQPTPIHGTGRPRPAVGKLRAKSEFRGIRECCDTAGRKPIGKTGPRRVKVADPKLKAGINSRKQEEQQHNNWRSLSQQFESGRQRQPESAW